MPNLAANAITELAQRQSPSLSGNLRPGRTGVAALQRALLAGCCLLATLPIHAGAAQPPVFPDRAAVDAQQVSGRTPAPPDAAATLRIYGAVEAFIRGNSPTVQTAGLQPVTGCAVVLRLAGEVIGRGSAIGGPGSLPETGRIARAAEDAWAEASRRLPLNVKPEAREEAVRLLRQDLLISLELSGPLMRINANAYTDFDGNLQPGMDGIVALMDGKVGAVFPGAEASGSVIPSEAARRAVGLVAAAVRGDAGGGSTVALTEPAELEKKQGVTLYRFRTAHVAQWKSDAPPELLYRGQKLVLQNDVDQIAELWHIADRLAGNLINRATGRAPAGTINLSTGAVDPIGAREAALARVALLQYATDCAKRTEKGGPRETAWSHLVGRASPAADAYLRAARESIARAEETDRLATAAAVVQAADASGAAAELSELRKQIAGGDLNTRTPPGARGMVLWGASVEAGGEHGVEPALRSLMAATPIPQLPTEMPWLGWADMAVDAQQKRPPGQKSAVALREMRALVWKHQLQGVDAGPDGQDMVGGIAVPGSKAPPLPTWQTARLVAFLGTMLGEPELTTKADRPGEIVRLLGAARYLRQLQVDDTMGWMCADPTMAKGGLRNATWDQRSQTDATAMALMAVLEIIAGIEKAGR